MTLNIVLPKILPNSLCLTGILRRRLAYLFLASSAYRHPVQLDIRFEETDFPKPDSQPTEGRRGLLSPDCHSWRSGMAWEEKGASRMCFDLPTGPQSLEEECDEL